MMAENGQRSRADACCTSRRDTSPRNAELAMDSMMRRHGLAIASAAVCIAFALHAASARAAAPASPWGCSAAEYHGLDFWIGDWDTFESEAPNGASVARAHVEPIAMGCAVHELYEQQDGLIGDSILSYDPVRKAWQQTWVTNRGSIMVITGNFKDGALVLEGDVHLMDGRTVAQRITWKNEGGGVRESAVLSKDGGKTWAPAFDVVFRKHAGDHG
jgi:hypothetical protein